MTQTFMQCPSQKKMLRAQRAWLSIFLFLSAVAMMLAPEKIRAQAEVPKEYQIKAAFLFHFAQFVEWPYLDSTNADTSFRIGVLGDNPFGSALNEIVKGETIANRPVTILYSHHAEDLKDCQIVFISKSEKAHLPRVLDELKGGKILTVSEIENFAKSGGVINFYLENDKVHFEINPNAAEREKLKISSQLLQLGKIVKSEPTS
jgi:hypothetical protein